jgi:hypothetical protein
VRLFAAGLAVAALVAPGTLAVEAPGIPPVPPLPSLPSVGQVIHGIVDPILRDPPGVPDVAPIRDVGFTQRTAGLDDCVVGVAFYAARYTDSPEHPRMIQVTIDQPNDIAPGRVYNGQIPVYQGEATGQLVGAEYWAACFQVGSPWTWATEANEPCHTMDFSWARLRGTVGFASQTSFVESQGQWLHQEWLFGGVPGNNQARAVAIVIGNGQAP